MNDIIKNNLLECINVFSHLSQSSDYDAEKLSYSILYQLQQLDYFYCTISKNKDTSTTTYSPKTRPLPGMLAYFNLGRGFPKEIMDGHWCYILKDFGSKMLVIPCTSLKNTLSSSSVFEMDIENYNHDIKRISRLQFTDIRCLDIQRIDTRKAFFRVSEKDKKRINEHVFSILFDNEN